MDGQRARDFQILLEQSGGVDKYIVAALVLPLIKGRQEYWRRRCRESELGKVAATLHRVADGTKAVGRLTARRGRRRAPSPPSEFAFPLL